MTPAPTQLDALLDALYRRARDFGRRYDLPIWGSDDNHRQELREVVVQWLKENKL